MVASQVAAVAVAAAAEKPKVDGFEALASVGYGAATDNYGDAQYVEDIPADPFGFMLGVDVGYTFRFGLRLGLTYTHGFGREIEATRTGVGGAVDYPVHTHHQSDITGASVGYDWLLAPIRLRASLDGGLVWLNTTDNAGDMPAFTLLLAPGVSALWQLGPLELGVGAKYYAFLGFAGSLLAGARF